MTFILQGLRYIALPKCHILPEIHLENLSWGEQDFCQITYLTLVEKTWKFVQSVKMSSKIH